MAENKQRKKIISERQQKQLILMMRSYSPPGHPRDGPSREYAEDFWKNVSQTLNLLESDPIHWRDNKQWRSVWRYLKTRVTGKLNKNQKMTNFETQVANFLQNNLVEESHVNEEDENSVENIEVQPDINETLPDEPVVAPVRAQPIQRRRKTVGFVDQANIDQAGQHSQGTYVEPRTSTINHNANVTQTKTNETDFAQPSTSSNDQRKSNFDLNFDFDELDQPSTSTNQNIKSEPGTSQESPSSSTSRQDANSVTNGRKRKQDEDNAPGDELTRQLTILIKSGKRMALMASELRSYFQTITSIAENFQGMREQRRQETFSNINGFRTENMETNTSSVPQNPPSHEIGAQARSDDEETLTYYEERSVIDLTD